jgi:hypothetical protein
VIARCRGAHLRTTVLVIRREDDDGGTIVMAHYSDPALEAELAYRREMAVLAGRGTRSRRTRRRWPWRSR